MFQIHNKYVIKWLYFIFYIIIMKIDYYNGEGVNSPPAKSDIYV